MVNGELTTLIDKHDVVTLPEYDNAVNDASDLLGLQVNHSQHGKGFVNGYSFADDLLSYFVDYEIGKRYIHSSSTIKMILLDDEKIVYELRRLKTQGERDGILIDQLENELQHEQFAR